MLDCNLLKPFLVHGNDLSGSSGTIASPMYPHPYRHIVMSGSSQNIEIIKDGEKLYIKESKPVESLAGCFSEYVKETTTLEDESNAWREHVKNRYSTP